MDMVTSDPVIMEADGKEIISGIIPPSSMSIIRSSITLM